MKKIISIVTGLLILSAVAQAEDITYNCKTDKGTSVVLMYNNFPVQLYSLTIAGKEMRSQLDGHFGTFGGRPGFTLKDFPQSGLNTRFDISSSGTYTVTKQGSFSGQEYTINCAMKAQEAAQDNNSF